MHIVFAVTSMQSSSVDPSLFHGSVCALETIGRNGPCERGCAKWDLNFQQRPVLVGRTETHSELTIDSATAPEMSSTSCSL